MSKAKTMKRQSHSDEKVGNLVEDKSMKVTKSDGPPPGIEPEEEITHRKRFEHLVETRKTLEENLHKVTGALELLADIIRKEEGLIDGEAETQAGR